MIEPRAEKLFFDVLTAINRIEQFLGGKLNFTEYSAKCDAENAIERLLIIVGEAVNYLRQLDENIPLAASQLSCNPETELPMSMTALMRKMYELY